jgi:hypothetical protein
VKLYRVAMDDDESDNVSDSDLEIQVFSGRHDHSRKLLSRYTVYFNNQLLNLHV